LAESRDEQLDHAASMVARVGVGANAEAADGAHQFVGIDFGADLAGFSGGSEQLRANGHEAVDEVGVQRGEADTVGLQDCGESVLRDQEINEEVDPPTEGHVRRATMRQQDWTGLGARLNLMAVHRNHEIRSRGEVAVNRPHPDASRGRDVTHRRLDTGRDEHGGGGIEQRLRVALRVGSLMPGWLPRSPVDVGHCVIPSNSSLTKRNIVPYSLFGAVLRFLILPARRAGKQAKRCRHTRIPLWRNTVMRYRTLGRTGVQVSSLALGAVNFGKLGRTTQDEVTAIVDAADTVLSADVLDAIDAIVAPGVDLAAHEKSDTPPALLDAAQRRR
jgi:hypothetical protein